MIWIFQILKLKIQLLKKNYSIITISFYGSSYINHEDFKSLISQNDNFNFKNYALNSYGLDQIFFPTN